MKNRHLLLPIVVLALLVPCCGKSGDAETTALDESAFIQARSAMHDNQACTYEEGGAGAIVDRFRLREVTITNASLQTYPDPKGPTINPGGPLANYCWWVLGRDCPISWYGDERLEFSVAEKISSDADVTDLEDRCRGWLEDSVGIDLEDAVAVSLYEKDWMSMGYEGFDDGAYPVYVCLIPSGLLAGRQQSDVASCTLTVLAATEGGDTNMAFGYVTAIDFGG